MIHNLCENGIKYGKSGGNVNILVGQENGETTVLVEDDGIGIPLAHQDKVFERFYRVDKSHSHITGGTGLGLSIVKHGAKLHGARVFLSSTDNVGTEIKLVFPPSVN
jgi:two-component system phosphate regulon sensor histidine kinase PhoR